MLFNLALLAVAALPSTIAQSVHQDQGNDGPQIEVWTDHDDVYQRGERVRVHFRASESGYVTIFRIDTDGRVRVLYPIDPWDDNYARQDREYEVRTYGDKYAFTVDDYPGEGYIFGVISRDPYSYGSLVRGDHWDYRQIADGGRVTGDPYVALTDLVDRIVPPNYSEYAYDVQPYSVEQHYQYPRFLCYDCHSYASYTYWNPYSYSCFRFRIVIYDDPFYFPRRDFRGQRVIYRTAPRLAPRYVFKDRGPSEAWVTNVRERPVDGAGRRVVDRGVTSRDLGGNGRVPTPINTTGRRPSTSSGNAGASNGGYSGGRRTSEPDQGSVRQGGSSTDDRRPDVRSPNDRPGRQSDGTTQQGDTRGSGRRPDAITPPAPQPEDRQQPQLERRDPRREPERDNGGQSTQPQTQQGNDNSRRPADTPNERPPVDRQPQHQPDQPKAQEPQRQPDRPQPDRQPQREPDRPRVERQPENRPQPQARQPERRTEPKSEPKRVEKPQDPEQRRRS